MPKNTLVYSDSLIGNSIVNMSKNICKFYILGKLEGKENINQKRRADNNEMKELKKVDENDMVDWRQAVPGLPVHQLDKNDSCIYCFTYLPQNQSCNGFI